MIGEVIILVAVFCLWFSIAKKVCVDDSVSMVTFAENIEQVFFIESVGKKEFLKARREEIKRKRDEKNALIMLIVTGFPLATPVHAEPPAAAPDPVPDDTPAVPAVQARTRAVIPARGLAQSVPSEPLFAQGVPATEPTVPVEPLFAQAVPFVLACPWSPNLP